MRMLLVRHAEAVPLMEGIASDFHRPLTDLGKRQAAALGEAVKARGVPVTQVVTSPLVRAIVTAEILLNILTPGKEFVVTERLSCGELKPKKLSKLAFELGGSPLLVGHMPDLADYAGWLIGTDGDGVDFDKAAIACINCRNEIAKGSGQLEWLVPPAWFMAGS